MARVLVIENGDDWRAVDVPADWDHDDIDRYLNGMAYGRAAVLTPETVPDDPYADLVADLMAALERSLTEITAERRAELDRPCFTPLGKGRVCGHTYGQHFGDGACIAGQRPKKGEAAPASVCGCPRFWDGA